MTWPSSRVVAAAFRGIAQVIRTPFGPARGVASSDPEVYLIIGERVGLVCTRCGVLSPLPPVPTSQGLNGNAEPLLTPGTGAHAMFVLIHAARFGRQHETCGEHVVLPDLGMFS